MTPARSDRTRTGPVLVGWTAVGSTPATGARLGTVDERRRSAFRTERDRAFVAGRVLLGDLLTERFGSRGLVDTSPCSYCGGDHGPVAVAGVPALASLAYTADLVVAAVAPRADTERLGLDAEAGLVDPDRDADLARLLGVLPDSALRRWTVVEAVLKANGTGLRTDPARVRVTAHTARLDGEPRRYRWAAVEGPARAVVSVAWQPRSL